MDYDKYLMLLHHMEINHKEEILALDMDDVIRKAGSNIVGENISIGEAKEVIEKLIEDVLDKGDK